MISLKYLLDSSDDVLISKRTDYSADRETINWTLGNTLHKGMLFTGITEFYRVGDIEIMSVKETDHKTMENDLCPFLAEMYKDNPFVLNRMKQIQKLIREEEDLKKREAI